jgi:hypothetical protein
MGLRWRERPWKTAERLSTERYFNGDVERAERELYRAVIFGKVRARFRGKVINPEWLLAKMKFNPDDPYALPPDIELCIDDIESIGGFR